MTVPGIGTIVALSVVCVIADVERFSSGRHFVSYVGLDLAVVAWQLVTKRGRPTATRHSLARRKLRELQD